ncbi:MAG: MSMEG_4193 family putative phosphomutase [Chloroflexaceae bacterium]|nr:MSMEG_4193 family putative phosphomutase [Chloroflexaceae bacterium]NJL33124.1 MSMEG_4193 family putative phosphomutase [Chloroflexaceae bacterium]NJO05313.1 MSMEG_4193 family putative phosphomutase [Chloroflexaceae bacterium]
MNDWVKGRLAGWTPNVHLNDVGRQQAQHLHERLGDLPIVAIYSSPLDRTVETARFIADPRKLAVQLVEDVGEVRYGAWEGGDLQALSQHDLWPGVQHYPSGTRFPGGGETLGEVQMRAVAAIDRLRGRHPGQMFAIVSHADLLKLVIAYYIGMHIDLFQRLVINTASVTALAFHKMGPRLLAFNDTGALDHLRPAPPPAEEPAAQADPDG